MSSRPVRQTRRYTRIASAFAGAGSGDEGELTPPLRRCALVPQAAGMALHIAKVIGTHDVVPSHLFEHPGPHRETETEQQQMYEREARLNCARRSIARRQLEAAAILRVCDPRAKSAESRSALRRFIRSPTASILSPMQPVVGAGHTCVPIIADDISSTVGLRVVQLQIVSKHDCPPGRHHSQLAHHAWTPRARSRP